MKRFSLIISLKLPWKIETLFLSFLHQNQNITFLFQSYFKSNFSVTFFEIPQNSLHTFTDFSSLQNGSN